MISPWVVGRGLRCALCAFVLIAASLCCAQSSSSSSVGYTISLQSPEQHLVDVQISLPPGFAQRELQLPVWNALYQIRDFAQFVNWVRAKNPAGHSLAVREENKSLWQIQGCESGAIVEYQIYVDTPGPFGAELSSHHAFFNLAQILMYAVDARSAAMHVRLDHLPAGWRVATPLASALTADFDAANYDSLVDSPVEIGDFRESDFEESGGHFRVVVDANPSDYDMEKIVAALHKIVAAATGWMNDRPFETYMFLYHFPRGPAGGGMEHAYSTAIDINADVMKQTLQALTSLTAHEFFHLWNVKRIRPQTLEPVDYTKENFTRALWFSEGVTSTAEGVIQLRAGTIDEDFYLYRLGLLITELQRRPAHLAQSAEESSLDAWLEGDAYYRRPERSISYYNKGELLGVMLDLAVREGSHGQASLREVLQSMNTNYAKQGRFFSDSDGVRQTAEAVCHCDLGGFFGKYVSGTDEIPWNNFFRSVGLRVDATTTTLPDLGFIASRDFDGPMTVADVVHGSEAERAGLQPGDSILQIQGKLPPQELLAELLGLKPGDMLVLKVSGSRGERELKWKVGGRQESSYEVKDLDHVNPEQRARRAAWLKGEAQAAGQAPSAASKNTPLVTQ